MKNWKKNIWYFVRTFPAITYGIAFLLVAFITTYIDYFDFIIVPFIPIILVYSGLEKIMNEIICVSVIITTLLFLDLITFLLRRFFTLIIGSNLFTKIIVFVLSLALWIAVFLNTVGKLPIDT